MLSFFTQGLQLAIHLADKYGSGGTDSFTLLTSKAVERVSYHGIVEHAAIGLGANFQDIQRTKGCAQTAAVALFTVH
jgi:hypothetical protein